MRLLQVSLLYRRDRRQRELRLTGENRNGVASHRRRGEANRAALQRQNARVAAQNNILDDERIRQRAIAAAPDKRGRG